MLKKTPSKPLFVLHGEIPEQIKAEEEKVIFSLALFISPEQIGLEFDSAETRRLLDPLWGDSGLHSASRDNVLAFKLLARLLEPHRGDIGFYPQNSREWIALRKLFVEILGKRVPNDLLREVPGRYPIGSDSEVIDDTLSSEWEHLVQSYRYENPPVFDLADRIGIESLREVSRLRSVFYEGATLASLKRGLIESATAPVDFRCGSLYEILQRVPLDNYPKDKAIPDPLESPSVTGWLSKIVAEKDGEHLEEGLRRAARSAREVLFLTAVESVYGKYPSGPNPLELEEMFHCRRVFENPYHLLTDEKLLYFFADRMAKSGSTFLSHMKEIFKHAEINAPTNSGRSLELWGGRIKLNSVKMALAVFWVDPDYPVWLMSNAAVQTFLRTLGFPPEETRAGKVTQFMKPSSDSPGGSLFRSDKNLIREFSYVAEPRRIEFTFFGSVTKSCLHPRLQEHISGMRPPVPPNSG